jgi:hypothetical protein
MTISNRLPPVAVEYDGPKGRETKVFADPFKARRFYARMLREGRNPKVKKASE